MTDNPLGKRMAAALGGLLDAVPSARQVLPHLGALEHVLATHGVDGLTRMPRQVLEKASGQLKNLPMPADEVVLPELLSLLDLMLGNRPPPLPAPAQNDFRSSFMSDDKMSVAEITASEFERVLQAQEARPTY